MPWLSSDEERSALERELVQRGFTVLDGEPIGPFFSRTRAERLKANFGMTLEDYAEMFEAQGGRCAICNFFPERGGRALAVDHCHVTLGLRGLLCYRCNTALGHFRDSPQTLRRAAEYLERYEESLRGE